MELPNTTEAWQIWLGSQVGKAKATLVRAWQDWIRMVSICEYGRLEILAKLVRAFFTHLSMVCSESKGGPMEETRRLNHLW